MAANNRRKEDVELHPTNMGHNQATVNKPLEHMANPKEPLLSMEVRRSFLAFSPRLFSLSLF
jgi:hypothetical protein